MGDDQNLENMESHKALMIPMVLEHILGFCSVSDLKSCRQVSKFWRQCSSRKWSHSGCVKLQPGDRTSKFLTFVRSEDAANCYGNFWLLGAFPLKFSRQVWTVCGSSIKILTLYLFDFPTDEAFHNFVCNLVPNLQNLTMYSVKIKRRSAASVAQGAVQYRGNWNVKWLTISSTKFSSVPWMEMLMNFPALKYLTLEGEIQRVGELFQSICAIRTQHPERANLKSVNTFRFDLLNKHKTSENLLAVLTHPTLALQEILMSVNGVVTEQYLVRVLSANASSLRKLLLRGCQNEVPHMEPNSIFNQLPGVLANLTELILGTRVFTSMEFIKYTPNLVKLSIRDSGNIALSASIVGATAQEDLENIVLKHCVELVYIPHRLSTAEVKLLTKWMPNLESLSMILNNETLELVCEHWINLVALEAYPGSEVDEAGITGMSAEDIVIVNAEPSVVLLTARKANLTHLQHLRRMTLVSITNFSLGRCAVEFVFNQLTNLVNLAMDGYEMDPGLMCSLYARYPPYIHETYGLRNGV